MTCPDCTHSIDQHGVGGCYHPVANADVLHRVCPCNQTPSQLATRTAANALLVAATLLERRAGYKFKAGERLWRASEYGRRPVPTRARPDGDDSIGDVALTLCAYSGQMTRDVTWLRNRATALLRTVTP